MRYAEDWSIQRPTARQLRDLRRRFRHLFEREGGGLKLSPRRCAACGREIEPGERMILELCDACYRNGAAFPDEQQPAAPPLQQGHRRAARMRRRRPRTASMQGRYVVLQLARAWWHREMTETRVSQTTEALRR